MCLVNEPTTAVLIHGKGYGVTRKNQGYSLLPEDAVNDSFDCENLQSPSEALGTPLTLDCFASLPEGFVADCQKKEEKKGTCKEE